MSEPFDRALRAAARRSRPAGVCPDAAMLASYADNGLSADERRLVEAHTADCARCLEHLALLGAVSLDREAPEPSRSWLVRWGWLVPVATAVLVVAVWVRLPEQKAAQDVPAVVAKRAEIPRPPSAPPAAAGPASEHDMASQAPRIAAKVAQPARKAQAPPAEAKTDELSALERRDSARQKAESAPAAVAVPPAAPAAQPAAPVTQEQEAGQEKPATLRLGAATSKVAAPALSDAMKEEVRAESVAPRETVRARGNRIEQSKDGGSTWSSLLSEPQSTFTAVGCAQNGPCWIGTADGQVLRRTPDGFLRSILPVRARVTSIAAEGPLTALATLDGGQRFRTTDGGTTWKSVP